MSQEQRPRVYLIDGFSNIFRAFYAIRNLSNSKGEPTNAVFGFMQMLRKLLRDEQPQYIGIAMDVSSDTVRKEQYEEYKANRRPMPEDLKPQIPWIRKLVEAYKIPLLEMPRYEADDVLGTLAAKGSAAGYEVVLVSPDKDLMQLVGEGVLMNHPVRDVVYDEDGVAEAFGVPPHQVVDVLALMGDASDNVPGVPGIGEKGAKNLIKEHGTLEALLDKADQVKRKSYREGLQNHREQAELSKSLVTIHRDLPIDFEPAKLRLEEPDWQALLEICWQMDFQAVARDIEENHGTRPEPIAAAEEFDSAEDLLQRTAGLSGDLPVAVVGSEFHIMGMAVGLPTAGSPAADDERQAVLADFRREGVEVAMRQRLAEWCANPQIRLVGHDLKEVLRVLGPRADVSCRLLDTMLVSYLVRSALRSHDFNAVAMDRLHQTPISLPEAGFDKGEPPMIGDSRLASLAAERVLLPWQMAETMFEELESLEMTSVYDRLEEPLVSVLATVEETGVCLDVEFLGEMSGQLAVEIDALESEIYELADEKFNINSPKQLGEILFEKLGYPVLRKTRKTKNYSTDAETLEALSARGFDLPERLLRFRELSKLKSTYVDALPALTVPETGRIHTRFNQAVAATGRLSSAHPNLQNIPIRTEQGQRVRKAFRASPGMHLVVADYSQIELRVLAHVAQEETMLAAFRSNEDIHASTAAAVFGGSPLLINSEQRRMAKVINFGIIYGMTSWGLARNLGISKKDAQTFIDTYMDRYPGVRRYTETTLEEATETGQVTTLYGRVRQLPDIRSRNWNLRENAKRMAINAPIQGTAADLLKLAMIAVEERLRADWPDCRLLLTVHDELVLEGPAERSAGLSDMLRQEMAGVAELSVPLVVDAGIGETWYDAKA